jgi:TldD protein
MHDLIEKVLSKAGHFCEVRIQSRISRGISVSNGILMSANARESIGAGIRVLVNGTWGFASTSDLSVKGLTKALSDAETMAKLLSKSNKHKIEKLDTSRLSKHDRILKPNGDLRNIPIDKKIETCINAEKYAKSLSPLVSNTSAMFREVLDTKWIQTTDGAKVTIEDPKPQFYVMATVAKDGQMTSSYEAEGVTGGMDDLFYRKTPEQFAEKAVKLAVDKLIAPHIVGGMYTVVLAPAMVGILSHEAIGHTVEADFVLQGSIAAQKMGQKVGSELVTLKDAGTNTMNVGHPSGDIGIDDEGVETQDVGIIVDGVMRSYLHNRETAAHFGVKPTGNARAWSYTDIPIIRMRNTYIMPGDKTPEEIISSTNDGLYIVSPGSGQADANAEFMFGCEEIYEIKNGKVGKLFKNATISGDAFEVLKSVDMLGNDFTWAMGSGYCGKGQPAAVDGGGPTLRCKAMIGGQA